MFDILCNKDESTFDLSTFDWYDVSNVYKNFHGNNKNETPSLANVCKLIGKDQLNFHDSLADAKATKYVMESLINEQGLGNLLTPRFISKIKKSRVAVK